MSQHLKKIVKSAFAEIFENPNAGRIEIEKYFAENYIQSVDDKVIDFEGFVRHIALQKKVITCAKIKFLNMLQEGNKVSTVHYVEAIKHDGNKVEIKVMALFQFEDDKIIQCDELTLITVGSKEDRDLGSRH